MAQYRITAQGGRGTLSRLGHKTTGAIARVNGWHLGIHVSASYDEKTESDVFVVSITGGSGHGAPDYSVHERRNAAGVLTGFEVSERAAEIPDGA
jgi:hypothetical protein